MNIFTITVAFCPAAQLARTLLKYQASSIISPTRHIIVDGHYPLNKTANQRDIRLIVEAYQAANPNEKIQLMDPGRDLGSAQSQNWAIEELHDLINFDEDCWINLDPDAACITKGWDAAMRNVLEHDPKCILVTTNSPMVEGFIQRRHQAMEERKIGSHTVMLPDMPTPFNLSMWRLSFLRDIGGIPQLFPSYGEVEGPMYQMARQLGYYNCYLKHFMEDEDGKLMHDQVFEDWKDAHARNHTFLGNFEEYCLSKDLI